MNNVADTLELGVLLFECLEDSDAVEVIKQLKSRMKPKTTKEKVRYSDGSYAEIEKKGFYSICKPYNFYYSDEYCNLNIMLEHSAVIDRFADTVIAEVKNVLHHYFGIEYKHLNSFKFDIGLRRIEFNRDHYYKEIGIFHLIKKLLTIAPGYIQSKHYNKDITDNENEYTVSYASASNKTVQVKIYNKDMEQLEKLKKGQISRGQYQYYRNTIRTEIKVKNGKLNAENNKYYIPKDLNTYMDEWVADYYFNKYVSQIVFQEPFYRLDIAKKMIKSDSILSNNMKKKLCDLLEMINQKGFTYTKENYKHKSAFGNHIKELRNRNINPLTLDNKLAKELRITVLENFTTKENSIRRSSKQLL